MNKNEKDNKKKFVNETSDEESSFSDDEYDEDELINRKISKRNEGIKKRKHEKKDSQRKVNEYLKQESQCATCNLQFKLFT